MRKPYALSVLGLAGLVAVAAVTAAPSARAEELKVLYGASNLMKPIFESYEERFKSAHNGVRVNFEPALEYTDALAITLRQSLIGELHDVGYYGVSDVCLLAERGIAKPLDGHIASDPLWGELGMPAGALDVTKCNGGIYGLPFSASYMVLIFNETLVSEAGGDPENLPTTWPDILALAAAIESQSGGISMNYEGSSSWSFMTLVLSQGGKILIPDGKDIAFDSEEGLKALQLLADIGAVRGHSDLTKAQGRQAFVSGTLGILVDSSSGLVKYRQATKDNFDIGVVPFPVAENGKVPASGMVGVLQTTSGDREKLAWDFLRHGASPDGQTLVGEMTGFFPFNQIAIKSADKLGTYYAENPHLRAASESVNNATAWPAFPGPNGLKIHEVVIDYMQKVYTGAIEPEIALSALAEETRALLK